jgi:piezo-type mechanosensitive ion channel component 1/2
MLLSALQIRYGFPIMKKPSSVLQYNEDPLFVVLANVYSGLPFIVELRSLLDFTFSKTSLDIFQFWQLWMYNYELFCAKNGNYSYTYKVLGSKTWWLDKIIFGWLFSTIIMLLLVGPLFFFSDVGGFVAPNPVSSGDFKISMIITKQLTADEISN